MRFSPAKRCRTAPIGGTDLCASRRLATLSVRDPIPLQSGAPTVNTRAPHSEWPTATSFAETDDPFARDDEDRTKDITDLEDQTRARCGGIAPGSFSAR